MTTEDLRHLPRVIRPYLAVMSTFLALNLAVGFFIWRVTDLDLLTSLFCAAPGGMTDTPLIALDMGADASMVAVMQFVRMVFGMACLPSIIVLADRKIEGDQMVPEEGQGTHSLERKKAHVSLRKFLPTFAVALAAGILGKLSGVPAGTLSASLIAVIVLKFAGSAPTMPMWVRRLAQVVSGCCIGAGITRDQIFQLRQLVTLGALQLLDLPEAPATRAESRHANQQGEQRQAGGGTGTPGCIGCNGRRGGSGSSCVVLGSDCFAHRSILWSRKF